jgi:hypothetical protein
MTIANANSFAGISDERGEERKEKRVNRGPENDRDSLSLCERRNRDEGKEKG